MLVCRAACCEVILISLLHQCSLIEPKRNADFSTRSLPHFSNYQSLKTLVGVSVVWVLINVHGSTVHGMCEGGGRCYVIVTKGTLCDCYCSSKSYQLLILLWFRLMILYVKLGHTVWWCLNQSVTSTHTYSVCLRRQWISSSLCMSNIAAIVQFWNLLVNNTPWSSIYSDLVSFSWLK